MSERLLKMSKYGIIECSKSQDPECGGYCSKCATQNEIIRKLYEYEQAEADGTLVRLPCKVGDTVYWIHKRFQEAGIISGTVKSIKISSFGYDLEILDSCDHTIKREFEKVFLTREAAEQALKELEAQT